MSQDHMAEAIALAEQNVKAGGSPFGAVLVRDGKVLERAVNEAHLTGDPTAHAELVAIQRACREQGADAVRGATVYASGQPCPMCLSACYAVGVGRVVFAGLLSPQMVVLRQWRVLAGRGRSAWWSERKYREVLSRAALFDSLRDISGVRLRQSAVKLRAMVDAGPIVPRVPMNRRWIVPAAPSPASWHSTQPCASWWPESYRDNGHHSRSRDG